MPAINHNHQCGDCEPFRALQVWREKCRGLKQRLEIAEKAAMACPKPLVWTDEPEFGAWNWWRDEDSQRPKFVYKDGTVAITMLAGRRPYQLIGGQWAGPIAEPIEQKE